jgi:hypothetical protein
MDDRDSNSLAVSRSAMERRARARVWLAHDPFIRELLLEFDVQHAAIGEWMELQDEISSPAMLTTVRHVGLLTELSASVAIAGTIACHGTRQALSSAKNCFAKGGGSGAGAPFWSASSASAP